MYIIPALGCDVHHTGACGIRCRGTGCIVSDNHIHDVGLTYPSAIAMQGGGRDCQISHNEIHETPYTAVNCGGQNNRIEHNLIYHAMQELHDGAGISSGTSLTPAVMAHRLITLMRGLRTAWLRAICPLV